MNTRIQGVREQMERHGRKRSLNDSIWTVTIITLVISAAVFIISTLLIALRIQQSHEKTEAAIIINNISAGIHANIDNYNDISHLIMYNYRIRRFLLSDALTEAERENALNNLSSITEVCSSIDSAFVIRNDGDYISICSDEYELSEITLKDPAWRSALGAKSEELYVCQDAEGAITRADGKPAYAVVHRISDSKSQEEAGLLILVIDNKVFDELLRSQSNIYLSLINKDGVLFAGNAEVAEDFSESFDSEEIVFVDFHSGKIRLTVSGCSIADTPFIIMCATHDESKVIPHHIAAVLLALLTLYIGSIMGFNHVIRHQLTIPIAELTEAMEKTKSSGFLEKINVRMPANEMGELATSYNDMIEHLNSLLRKLIENEKLAQRAEMRVLYEQIKPHFLYNSLETIGAMALEDEAEDVHSALETLGSFYRNFLSRGNREIPLRTELRIIRDYLALQNLRYGNIISDEYDVEEAALDFPVPKLMLQPLVENSISHGIRMKGEPGLIRISAHFVGRVLKVTVYDNGIGMPQDKIDALLETGVKQFASDSYSASGGFGLAGTIERIRRYCNSSDVINIHSVEGEYTEIEFVIPCDKEIH